MARKLTVPIRFSPKTVELLKKGKIKLKEFSPKKKKITYDDVVCDMFKRLGWRVPKNDSANKS